MRSNSHSLNGGDSDSDSDGDSDGDSKSDRKSDSDIVIVTL